MTPTINDVEPTTSASDEVRHLLDERGVEWWPSDEPWNEGVITHWHAGPFKWTAIEGEDGLWLNAGVAGYSSLLPEQAIEATLGPLTERTAKDSEKDSDGCGECHDTHESRWFHCSECGFGMSDLYTDAPWTEEDQPKHCPNCGAKVVSE